MSVDRGQLPYRGALRRPAAAGARALASRRRAMPSHCGGASAQGWRYVGVYGPELMLCVGRGPDRAGPPDASGRCGTARAVACTSARRSGAARSHSARASAACVDRGRRSSTWRSRRTGGIETVCPSGDGYALDAQAGRDRARAGRSTSTASPRAIDARAVIDDTAAYYERHTRWRWSAGVGTDADGRGVAWNLVAGVNDPPSAASARCGSTACRARRGRARSPTTCARGRTTCASHAEASRERRENLLLVRSSYRQPFGTFSGDAARRGRDSPRATA